VGEFLMHRRASIILCVVAALFPYASRADDQVIFRYRVGDGCAAKKPPSSPTTIFDGKYGSLIKFQAAAASKLTACGTPLPVANDGFFGCGLRKAIITLAQCPQVKAVLPVGTSAVRGDLTEAMWRALISDAPPPDMEARIKALVLTFERTDYGRVEWNFCQSPDPVQGAFDPNIPGSTCRSNDRNSFLTWGPRGATAGGGREIQNILSILKERYPLELKAALGEEERDITGLIGLSGCDTERYLCAKWLRSDERERWSAAFRRLAAVREARQAFDDYYATDRSDGPKVRAFFETYRHLNIKPTQIDYAFFVDRATHTAGLPDKPSRIADQVENFIGTQQDNWRVRRAMSVLYPARGDQQVDRLGRDAVFFVDAVGEANLEQGANGEDVAWRKRSALKASDFGLSDGVVVAMPAMPKSLDLESEGSVSLPQGLQACPSEVLLRRNKAGLPKPSNACQ